MVSIALYKLKWDWSLGNRSAAKQNLCPNQPQTLTFETSSDSTLTLLSEPILILSWSLIFQDETKFKLFFLFKVEADMEVLLGRFPLSIKLP